MNRWTAPLAAALLLGSAPAGHAQAADSTARPNSLVAGARALSFGIPQAGSGTFGYWKMRSDRSALGLQASVQLAHDARSEPGFPDASGTTAGAGLGLDLRRYARTDARVAPFAQIGVNAGYSRSSTGSDSPPTSHVNTVRGGLEAGIGAEWFPMREVSVAGVTGATLFAQHASDSNDAHQTTVGLSTFTSSLSLQIYF